jgi:hypothetical protein
MPPKRCINFRLRYALHRIKPALAGATFFLCAGLPLGADVRQPCPVLSVAPLCAADGQARLQISAAADMPKGLRLLITPQGGGSTQGLAAGQTVTLDAIGPTTGQMTLAVLGLEGEGAAVESCCFSNQRLRVPVCTPPAAPDPADNPTSDPAENANDFAVTLTLPETCPRNGCQGQVTIDGPSDSTVDLTLSTDDTPARISAAGCLGTGAAGALCRVIAGTGLDLSLVPGKDASAGELELCAVLGIGTDAATRTLALQQALADQGYDPGPADGDFGPATLAAVQTFAADAGQPPVSDEIAPDLLTLLGLGPFSDANPGNNRACATTTLPRPILACDPASTRAAGAECACRFKGMKRASDTACACPKGQSLGLKGCVAAEKSDPVDTNDQTTGPDLRCDPATTVLRNGVCQCRSEGMRKVTETTCEPVVEIKRCASGLPEIPGLGCDFGRPTCSRVNDVGECCDNLPAGDLSCR